jgi:hypothetical protein
MFIDPMDIEAIGMEIRRLSEFGDREDMIIQGRKIVEDQFSWEKEEKSFCTFLNN